MARRRFFVDTVEGGRAILEGEPAEHLRKVLRTESGRIYEISDNRDVYLAEIENFSKSIVSFRILEKIQSDKPIVRITLLASLIKFDHFEWMVEKATELGVEKIIPVIAERSDKGLGHAAAKRSGRWRKIAIESSQQSRRARLPEIAARVPFKEAVSVEGHLRLLLEEERGAPPFLSALGKSGQRSADDVVCLLAGPEGGWTPEERATAAADGWSAVSLGPTILRAETAVVAAIALVNGVWQALETEEPSAADARGGL